MTAGGRDIVVGPSSGVYDLEDAVFVPTELGDWGESVPEGVREDMVEADETLVGKPLELRAAVAGESAPGELIDGQEMTADDYTVGDRFELEGETGTTEIDVLSFPDQWGAEGEQADNPVGAVVVTNENEAGEVDRVVHATEYGIPPEAVESVGERLSVVDGEGGALGHGRRRRDVPRAGKRRSAGTARHDETVGDPRRG